MSGGDISVWLGIAAFAISLVLAILKGIEFYGSRRASFTASVRLTGSEEIGNTIVLLNKSNIPATISYFDLVWVKRRSLFGCPVPFTREISYQESLIDPSDSYDETVPPHGVHALVFADESHFAWGYHIRQNIYLRLWLIGRRQPIWIWVTGPSKHRRHHPP